MILTILTQPNADGRWLAEVPELPGVLAYGTCQDDAGLKVQVLALRVVAERLEAGEITMVQLQETITFHRGEANSARDLYYADRVG